MTSLLNSFASLPGAFKIIGTWLQFSHFSMPYLKQLAKATRRFFVAFTYCPRLIFFFFNHKIPHCGSLTERSSLSGSYYLNCSSSDALRNNVAKNRKRKSLTLILWNNRVPILLVYCRVNDSFYLLFRYYKTALAHFIYK